MTSGFGVPRMDWSPLQAIGQQLTINAELERQRELERQAVALMGQNIAGLVGAPGDAPLPQAAGFGGPNSVATSGAPAEPTVNARADGTPINQPGALPTFAGGGTGGAKRLPVDPDIENKFVETLKAGGLTNPYGLAAVAAYAQHESRYSPKNIVGSWSDPSERGQAGTSGGILSWRDDRLANMRKATAGAPDPVVAQAKFTLAENPDLTLALQSAKSPEEAHDLMRNAWRYAGFNRSGGETAARLATTRAYVPRVAGEASSAVLAGGDQLEPRSAPQRPPFEPGSIASPALAGGAPAGPAAAPAAAAPRLTPEQGQRLQAMYANPITRPAAMRVIAELQKQPKYDFKVVDDQLVRTDARGGAVPVGIGKAPKFDVVKGSDGNDYILNPQTGEMRRAIQGRDDTTRDLTPEEKRARGIDPATFAQIDAKGDVSFPGKPATQVNIGDSADKAAAIKSAGALVDRFDGVAKEGDQARGDVALVGELRALGNEIGTGGVAALQSTLANYGIKTEGSGKIEAYNALVDRLTPQQRVPGAGATSDFDARMFKGSLPRLINTPEGNALIADTMEAVAKDKIARGQIADMALLGEQRGGISMQDAMKQLKALPSIQTGFRQRLAELGKAGKLSTAAPAGGQPGATSAPQPGQLKPMPPNVVEEARKALQPFVDANGVQQPGRDRNGVIEKLRRLGFDPSGL